MCGGGTSYDVYFRKADKPSYPLHRNGSYCTVIMRDGGEYFEVCDAIDPKSRWDMELGWPKYEAHGRLERIANRLAVRIAARVFPELKGTTEAPNPVDRLDAPERSQNRSRTTRFAGINWIRALRWPMWQVSRQEGTKMRTKNNLRYRVHFGNGQVHEPEDKRTCLRYLLIDLKDDSISAVRLC